MPFPLGLWIPLLTICQRILYSANRGATDRPTPNRHDRRGSVGWPACLSVCRSVGPLKAWQRFCSRSHKHRLAPGEISALAARPDQCANLSSPPNECGAGLQFALVLLLLGGQGQGHTPHLSNNIFSLSLWATSLSFLNVMFRWMALGWLVGAG